MDPDHDVDGMDREQLILEVKRLRAGIRAHRDSTGHDLCWHHPDLWGGTGQTCNWPAARATLPFARFLILSGGLNGQNVGQAIVAATPHAVDVCSGVESAPGVKDHRAIKDFIAAVQTADRLVSASSLR